MSHAPTPGQQLSLAALSQAEVELLALLGEGHTVKSIANLTGRTPAWINDRLRDARRKTGASTSRELARLLRAQKIWPKEIGVAPPAIPPVPAPRAPALRRRAVAGGLIMIACLASALALYNLAPYPAPQASTPAATAQQPEAVAKQYMLSARIYRDDVLIGRPSMAALESTMVSAMASGAYGLDMMLLPLADGHRSVALNFRTSSKRTEYRFATTVRLDDHGTAKLDLPHAHWKNRYRLELEAVRLPSAPSLRGSEG